MTQYINSNFGLRYDNIEILEIIDEYIQPLSIQYRWGYDAAYYIASVTGCHPNYASFLLNRQTLHVQDIYAILNHLDIGRRMLFDRKYINEEYLHYMSHHVDDREALERLKKCIAERPVLLLAPGKSLKTDQEKIMELLEKDDYFAVSVNFIPSNLAVDMMFVSNMKRFRSIEELGKEASGRINIIATSNISTIPQENRYIIDYSSYLNEEQCISDRLQEVGILRKDILIVGQSHTDRLRKSVPVIQADDKGIDERITIKSNIDNEKGKDEYIRPDHTPFQLSLQPLSALCL